VFSPLLTLPLLLLLPLAGSLLAACLPDRARTRAATLADARRDVYAAIDDIHFPSGFFRTDIAERAASGQIGTPAL